VAWLGRQGVSVQRVMTDNGSAYRYGLFRKARPTPALHAQDQRQGRALHPDPPARADLRPAIRLMG